MPWEDDFDADERGERRPERAPVTGWRVARLTAAYTGIVVGAVGLVIGTVVAVNVIGTATNPGGFAAPAAAGSNVALPPTVIQPESDDQRIEADADAEGEPEGDGDATVLEEPIDVSGFESSLMEVIDGEWIARVSGETGIPERALSAYASAHVLSAADDPECGLDWATIAAIGEIESGHASHGSTTLDENGDAQPPIIGRALDGDGVAKITDTDGGLLDGDATWDRAVGPMQFIPSTWEKWGSDANGDGVADPNQIDDAALATAGYLCASGAMTTADGWRAAVFSYNHDNDYVDKVAKVARGFAESAG
ncbi:lytic transglycosylase domain-containing protein [Agromyces salentinus]|uniref:Transglycosylase SLT domain-containing protein n=1 Tax=Agromyces salentinus TaxID=269421 RepID=A0ABP4YMW7_9MICO|nr:lytic transglycosylase domain-containing protein [Agromyces salentinus]